MFSQIREIEYRGRVNRIGWALVIMIGAMNVIGVLNIAFYDVLWAIGSENVTVSVGAIIDTVCYLSYFLIPSWLFYIMSKKIAVEPIKFRPKFSKYLPLMIVAGIGISFGAAIINDWFCVIINYSLPQDNMPYYISNPELIALYMTVSLAPAFAEELLFRGVIYTNLRPYGKISAVLISALAFGLMHQNVGQFLYTTVAGICLAMIYEETESIWGCIFMHMFFNLFSVMTTAVQYRYDETVAIMIVYLMQAILIFAGAICLFALIQIKKREDRCKKETKEYTPSEGLFGFNRLNLTTPSHNTSMSVSDAFKIALKTPGIICFLALSVLSAMLLIFLYSGGGIA